MAGFTLVVDHHRGGSGRRRPLRPAQIQIAVDAVSELEGSEALTGLWTLFTKCKTSLKDGHRLENISWRLWHRELATSVRNGPTSESGNERDDDYRSFNEKAERSLLNDECDGESVTETTPSTHLQLPSYSISSSSPRSHPISSKSPTHISPRRNTFVGKIILDMLPNPVPPTQPIQQPRGKESSREQCDSPTANSSSYFTLTAMPVIVPDTHSLPIRCHLPTPAGSELHLMSSPKTTPATAPIPPPNQPESLPQVHVHIETAPSTPPSTLPQLVIVHPTPGPTPHPTPPATPILGVDNPRQIYPSQALTPSNVQSSPKFTLRSEGSMTSSSSDCSSTSIVSTSSATTTSTEPATAKPHAASTSGVVNNIIAPPPLSNASTSGSTTSPLRPSPPTLARKSQSSPITNLHLSPDAESSRSRPRAQGHIRQVSSTSSAGGKGKEKEGNRSGGTKSKSKSRSRSRGAEGARAGLMMMMTSAATTGATGKKTSAITQRSRAGGMRKSTSGKGTAAGARAIAREKRPTFNIGSHSDDLGSKSAGSGSSVSAQGPSNGDENGNGGVALEGKKKEQQPQRRQNSLAPPRRTHSATTLMPTPAPPPLRPPLPDPSTVLPSKQQQPRRLVLATSDSDDYETETDVSDIESDHEHGDEAHREVEEEEEVKNVEEEGDTADWSSEDMSADEEEEVTVRRTSSGGGHENNKKGQVPNPQRTNSAHNNANAAPNNRPQAARRHHTLPLPPQAHHHGPAQAQHHHPLPSRALQSRRAHAANAQFVVEQAAREAERIKDMFAKKPVPSSEDLAAQRTRSVGLLSQLMHPDPMRFPPSHPYRRGHSSGDVKGTKVFAGGLTMTRHDAPQVQMESRTPRPQLPTRRASAGPAPGMKLSKSSAAIPVASQVQVGSISREEGSVQSNGKGNIPSAGAGGGYRPKGRPVDQEMEDTESEGEGGEVNGILVSKSVAQAKLQALAQRRGIVTHEQRREREEEEPVPEWARAAEVGGLNGGGRPLHQSPTSTVIPAPIPLGHPYNLPAPALPSTPRTTRRQMLQTEMSESLRRNLLWERQVSKISMTGFRRSTSGGGSGRPGPGGGTVLGGGPLKPLTALPSMVQLTAKQPGTGNVNNPSPRERRTSGGALERERDREEIKKRALARNRSWADAQEYHVTGW
ncbi:hypothetical protein H0H93_015155 [Arthromyces matolae]|nr:hypothetical protein H0H93_015155 [Arthromyces matolae]